MKQLLEGACEVLSRFKKRQLKDETQAKQAILFQKIAQPKLYLKWHKSLGN